MTGPAMRTLLRPALWFVAIGLLLYGALFAASETLVRRLGHSHPVHKLLALEPTSADWVVLGASHAMPLDFGDTNAAIERRAGQRIVNLAGPGTGPLYNRFVFEQFLQRHRARRLLVAADAFAFCSPMWNEDRFADAKLLRRTPLDASVAAGLAAHVRDDGLDPRLLLDYLSGFSKINNRERFVRDVWDGEAQFDRSARPSTSAVNKRIAYLYPQPDCSATRPRYLAALAGLIDLARAHGVERIVVVKLPLPPAFRRRLPDEAGFDEALRALLAPRGVEWADFAAAVDDPALYYDTDHLNRRGVAAFVDAALLPLLTAGPSSGP